MTTTAERAEARAAKKYARRQNGYQAAKARTCPVCRKMSALGKALVWPYPGAADAKAARQCRYCGHWEVQS
jgi:hypothetical protein